MNSFARFVICAVVSVLMWVLTVTVASLGFPALSLLVDGIDRLAADAPAGYWHQVAAIAAGFAKGSVTVGGIGVVIVLIFGSIAVNSALWVSTEDHGPPFGVLGLVTLTIRADRK